MKKIFHLTFLSCIFFLFFINPLFSETFDNTFECEVENVSDFAVEISGKRVESGEKSIYLFPLHESRLYDNNKTISYIIPLTSDVSYIHDEQISIADMQESVSIKNPAKNAFESYIVIENVSSVPIQIETDGNTLIASCIQGFVNREDCKTSFYIAPKKTGVFVASSNSNFYVKRNSDKTLFVSDKNIRKGFVYKFVYNGRFATQKDEFSLTNGKESIATAENKVAGKVEISVISPCSIFIEKKESAKLSAFDVKELSVSTGSVAIEAKYSNGHTERKRISVTPDETVFVAFEYAMKEEAEDCFEYARNCYKQEDYKNAFHYSLIAANGENIKAQSVLGYLYLNGLGTEKNIDEALYWFSKSEEAGFQEATFYVGYCYEQKRNYKKATEWYKKAQKHGNNDASARLAQLNNRKRGSITRVNDTFGIRYLYLTDWQDYALHGAAVNMFSSNLGHFYIDWLNAEAAFGKEAMYFSGSIDIGLWAKLGILFPFVKVGAGFYSIQYKLNEQSSYDEYKWNEINEEVSVASFMAKAGIGTDIRLSENLKIVASYDMRFLESAYNTFADSFSVGLCFGKPVK